MRPVSGRSDHPTKPPRPATVAAAVLFTTALCVVAAEALARLVRPVPVYTMFDLKVQLDPRFLYRVLPGGRQDLNRAGYRDREWDDADPRPRLYVLGDSFVMGLSLPLDRTFPAQLQSLLGPSVTVRNLGVQGYGPDQELLRFLAEGEARAGDSVVLTLFAGNDLEDLLRNELVDVDLAGELVVRKRNPVTEALPAFRSVMLLRGAFLGSMLGRENERQLLQRLFDDVYIPPNALSPDDSPRSRALLLAVLRRLRADAGSRRARLVAVVVPSWESVNSPAYFTAHGLSLSERFGKERTVESIVEAAGIPCVSLREVSLAAGTAHYNAEDHHWTVAGAGAAATEVARKLAEPPPLR